MVSIIIPVYNRVSYIKECVNSALNQTISSIEVIICDNKSTDGTWELCEELFSEDRRIRLFRNSSNIGPVRNWALCAKLALGKYIKILFSDDVLFPNFLEKTLYLLENNESIGFVYTSALIGRDFNEKCSIRYKNRDGKDIIVDNQRFIRAHVDKNNVPVSPCAALFRVSDFKKNLILDVPNMDRNELLKLGAGPDLLLYLLTANEYPKVAHVNSPHVFFRDHEGSLTQNNKTRIRWLYWQSLLWFVKTRQSNKDYKYTLNQAWLDYCIVKREIISKSAFMETMGTNDFNINYMLVILLIFKRAIKKYLT